MPSRNAHLFTAEQATSALMNGISPGIIAYLPHTQVGAITGIGAAETDIQTIACNVNPNRLVSFQGTFQYIPSTAPQAYVVRFYVSNLVIDAFTITNNGGSPSDARTFQVLIPLSGGVGYTFRMSLQITSGSGTVATAGNVGGIIITDEGPSF